MPETNGHGNGTAHGGDGHRLASLTLVPRAATRSAAKDFKSDQEVRWCPGCGDYAILAAFQAFLPELEVPRENIVVISGIGCSSRLPYYVNSYGMHSIHGRAPAIATGLAASRPDLSVWVITGDGDALSIGGNHLIHALRRNVNIKVLLFNNRIYGLTKGQYSPTSERGKVTKSTPFGSLDHPFNPVSLALGADASFVARTIDSDRRHLTSVLRAAADHQGAAFIEIYQNCPIFNDDAFAPLKEASAADQRLIRLEHGEPVRFAGGSRGLRFGPQGQLEAVEVTAAAAAEGPGRSDAAAEGPGKSDAAADEGTLITHDAHRADPSYAFALSRLDASDFRHTPVGVFRQVEQPSYDQLMAEQIEAAKQRSGSGDLAALLAGNDTWEVN
jgi:2-oxoglutarate/2-oxoacid ferredoxin oxidoreductase subunit beta